ncbi:hypothetical protein DFH08DRAFT_938813 [Mycena albidolilacea]|uniref:Uncharacterized protein n=1 Tax=Mycena albidolilacea TaxID=1033008 RepID=A0AAD6ZTH6_9AGAR|nr:hypothetical protein DFH08DRAFT_938813 [Mycena albidolilacea]
MAMNRHTALYIVGFLRCGISFLPLPPPCSKPVSLSVNPASEKSLVTLDWVLVNRIAAPRSAASGVLTLPSGGSICSMHIKASICLDLPYNLVLGRDWLFFCRETLPHLSFTLSSGIVHPRNPSHLLTIPLLSTVIDGTINVDGRDSDIQSESVLNVIMDATDKQLSTESLSHIATALKITVSGTRNDRFKLRAAIRSHTKTINTVEEGFCSSVSMAEFFSSFESHQKPVPLSIAALHRIDISERVTVGSLRTQITQHILSGHYCADVHNEWQFNSLDGDFQAHILTAIHGNYDPEDSIVCSEGRKLKGPENKNTLPAKKPGNHMPKSFSVSAKCGHRFYHSSEALSTFTCAVCAKSASLRSHCSVVVNNPDFDLSVLVHPDFKADKSNLLNRYK